MCVVSSTLQPIRWSSCGSKYKMNLFNIYVLWTINIQRIGWSADGTVHIYIELVQPFKWASHTKGIQRIHWIF